jgi:hypothetical protein
MGQFVHWPDLLAEHGSDADYRKNTDPSEGPKHYIDIDNYPEFVSTGRIPGTLDSVLMIHSPGFVDDNGYLPWATETTYDSLKACFMRGDWNKAVLFAADLGHYVGDGHMPLHLTRNYNGQYTGNYGIHYRYESSMINEYSGEISFEGGPIDLIGDVNAYIFNYIYRNYQYVDSVLAADDYAGSIAGNTSSAEYTAALWEKTGSFTIHLFSNASHALTELIYTAWVETGKPSMYSTGTGLRGFDPFMDDAANAGMVLEQNYPNPFRRSTTILFHLDQRTAINLSVMDETGRVVDNLLEESCPPGETRLEWYPGNLAPGNYYLVLKSREGLRARKMILLGN